MLRSLHALQAANPHHIAVQPLQGHRKALSTMAMLYAEPLTLTLFVRLTCLMPFSFRKGMTLSCSSFPLLKKSSSRHCAPEHLCLTSTRHWRWYC